MIFSCMLAGASPLGDMPPTSEMASLGLLIIAESEEPMLSNPGVSSSGAALVLKPVHSPPLAVSSLR